jgi:hypothetical protein
MTPEPGDAGFEPPPTLPRQIREKAEAERKTREAVTAGVVWAVLCGGFALVLVSAVLFRVQVVRMFPSTAGAYAAVKLPVNPVGLSLENVQGGPSLSNGRATLAISGVVRNVETEPRSTVPVRVVLFDKGGHKLSEVIGKVEGAPLTPGEARPFTVTVVNPPLNVAEYQVEFVQETQKRNPHDPNLIKPTNIPHPHGVKLRSEVEPHAAVATKAPEAAQPLPANSPYALPEHTSAEHAPAEHAPAEHAAGGHAPAEHK